jgi:hypothetical protein
MPLFLCGVDKGICTGSTTSGGAPYMHKFVLQTHGSPEDAFRCKVRSLLLSGYQRIGPREFQKPGEPILVLDKKSKFGQRLYYAKVKSRYLLSRHGRIIL